MYVMYKPWPRGVYVRYTPAVRNLFVIFPEGQRPEGYITNKLPNIAGVYLKIYTDWHGLYDIQVNKKFRKFERKYRDCIKRKGDKIGTQTCYEIST